MHNYKIIIEYDGTNFVGWQQQENGKSIQSALQEALVKLSSEKVKPRKKSSRLTTFFPSL